MSCEVHLKIESSKLEENDDIILIKGVDESEINFDLIADYIIKLDNNKRSSLADNLKSALMISLTSKDVANYNFISNTSITSLVKQYPKLLTLAESLPVDIKEHYTLILGNKLLINNDSTFGRNIDSNGNPVFFIRGEYGALRFLLYMLLKSNIDKAFKDPKTLNTELSNYLVRLETIGNHFKKTPKQLLIDYLNNNTKYKSFLDEQGNIVNSQKIILEILNKLGGVYTENLDKSDLMFALEAIKLKHINNFDIKVPLSGLYQVLAMFYPTIENDEDFNILSSMLIPSKKRFMALSEKDLNTLLHRLFIVDAKLYRAAFKLSTQSTQEEATSKTITKTEINNKWKTLLASYKKQGITLASLDKTLKDKSEEEVLGFINLAFEGDDRNITFTINEGKVVGTYSEVKEATKHLVMTFPWSKLGNVYNFGYTSKYLFSPVKKKDDPELDADGKYKGMYLYEFYNPDTQSTHFLISKNIISPYTKADTYNTLAGAKNAILKKFNEDRIYKLGMWKMKMNKGVLREIEVNETELEENSLLTVLDLELDPVNFNKFPTLFSDAFHGSLPDLYQKFNMIPNIQLLDTQEKAAYFILDFYNLLSKLVNEEEHKNLMDLPIHEIIDYNIPLAESIIEKIQNAAKNPISYLIEKRFSWKDEKTLQKRTIAYIRLLENNGTSVQISGKLKGNKAANIPTVSSLNSAAKYFNQLFKQLGFIPNVKKTNKDVENLAKEFINVLSRSELEEFSKYYHLNIENNLDGIRAFVFLGKIIINGSNADLSDLYHEMSHIFLGLVKVKYPDIYTLIRSNIETFPHFRSTNKFLHNLYKNFAEEDIMEEVMVSLIADNLFSKLNLLKDFEGTEVMKDFNLIFNSFPKLASEMLDTGLEFEGFMNSLMIPETMTQVNRNMKISQLIKQEIENKKIIKNCE